MSETQKVTFYTTPATYINEHSSADHPYERVVGIKIGGGDVIWSAVDDRPESGYDRESVGEDAVDLPKESADRLGKYFTRYFIENMDEPNNCHRFGYWMNGTPAAGTKDGITAPDFVTERFPIKSTDLKLGRWAVLGTENAANHSVVGLNDGRVIEVTGSQGFMAIEPIDDVIARFTAQTPTTKLYS